MSTSKLSYVSTKVFETLRADVSKNLDRYLSGNFEEMLGSDGWSLKLSVDADLERLRTLQDSDDPEIEVRNSLLVWDCLPNLTPALANEGRVWTRLTHIECLPYARARWIRGATGPVAIQKIEDHFFGENRTRCRDDNAIGRLWWNAYIARLAVPNDQEGALRSILRTADIRLNLVERAATASRPMIAAGIVRAISRNQKIAASEQSFRNFMKNLNRVGGGVLFEVMTNEDVDKLMDECAA